MAAPVTIPAAGIQSGAHLDQVGRCVPRETSRRPTSFRAKAELAAGCVRTVIVSAFMVSRTPVIGFALAPPSVTRMRVPGCTAVVWPATDWTTHRAYTSPDASRVERRMKMSVGRCRHSARAEAGGLYA